MATRSKRPQGISEKQFMAQVIQVANLCGWMTFHVFDSRRSAAGWPDVVLLRPPSLIFVELKTSTGRVSPSQQMWLAALSACPGVETFLWRPDDWPEIVSRLQKRDTLAHGETARYK